MCLLINENSVYYSLCLAGAAKRTAAEMASQQWEKLSPSEFQQLQELASCKYIERGRHTEHPSATPPLPKKPSIQPHKHKTGKYVAEESFCLAYYGRRKYLLNVKRKFRSIFNIREIYSRTTVALSKAAAAWVREPIGL